MSNLIQHSQLDGLAAVRPLARNREGEEKSDDSQLANRVDPKTITVLQPKKSGWPQADGSGSQFARNLASDQEVETEKK